MGYTSVFRPQPACWRLKCFQPSLLTIIKANGYTCQEGNLARIFPLTTWVFSKREEFAPEKLIVSLRVDHISKWAGCMGEQTGSYLRCFPAKTKKWQKKNPPSVSMLFQKVTVCIIYLGILVIYTSFFQNHHQHSKPPGELVGDCHTVLPSPPSLHHKLQNMAAILPMLPNLHRLQDKDE